MNCNTVQRSLSSYCDNRLSPGERRAIALHLENCRACAASAERLFELRGALRTLPRLTPPSELNTSLRVLASRERVRRFSRTGAGAFVNYWTSRARLWADDMLRPVALPIAGGLISALILFGVLAPTLFYAPPASASISDIPIWLSTEASFASMGPYGFADDDIVVVDLTLDPQGRMMDYSTPTGQAWVNDPKIRRAVENALLFTKFTPGTTFGQPAAARVRITFRRSEIDVRG